MKGHVRRVCTSFIDVPDKIAVAIYFSGCSLRCKGCQNPALWDPLDKDKCLVEEVLQKIKNHPLAEYVVFLGGEPTDQMDFLIELCKQIKSEAKKPIAIYTGREFEVLPKTLLDNIELIVCGPYREDLYVGGWPASSNQRVFRKKGKEWKC